MLAVFLSACSGDEPTRTPPDTGPVTLPDAYAWDDRHVLVVPETGGLRFVNRDGAFVGTYTWDELAGGACAGCTGEGATLDGDGILYSWSVGNQPALGGVGRLGPGGFEWAVEPLGFPHEALRDPSDGTVVVPEATTNRVVWIDGDGASTDAVRTLGTEHPDWNVAIPNGAERLERDGRTYLLLSSRGSGVTGGRVDLWDITAPDAPALAWRFPAAERGLLTPHGPAFREHDGRWWLLYAHTNGVAGGSSVGVAVTDDPTVLPEYVADLVPAGANAPFTFLRGVDLTDDAELVLVDSGKLDGPTGGAFVGRVMRAPWPTGLEPSGVSGGSEEQVYLDLPDVELVVEGLGQPFEGWLWEPTFSLD